MYLRSIGFALVAICGVLLFPEQASAQNCGLFNGNNKCSSTLYCSDPFTGTCKARGGSTDSCTGAFQGTCLAGYVCDIKGECRLSSASQSGELCGLGVPCASSLYCSGGRCATRRTVGDSCTGGGQGTCASNLLCDITGVCRNDPPREGQPCGVGVPCDSGFNCTALIGGICARPAKQGQSCIGTGQGTCDSGLLCDVTGVCRTDPPTKGDPCAGFGRGTCDEDVVPQLRCESAIGIGGLCVEAKAVGESCAGIGQGSCQDNLICDGLDAICRNNPPQLGQTCGALVPCKGDLKCVDTKCTEKGTSGARCNGLGVGSCEDGLVCDLGSGVCRSTPPAEGEACGGVVGCVEPLACSGTVTGFCAPRRKLGQTCVGLGRGNCEKDGVCNLFFENDAFVQKCFPEGNDAIPEVACARSYSPQLSASARLLGSALSFSTSNSAAAGVAGSLAAGTLYGPNGEYGCYTQACVGLETNVGASSSACGGLYSTYEGVEGPATVTVQSVSLIPGPGVSPEISTSQEFAPFDQGGELQGTETCVGGGVGALSVPLAVGIYDCNQSVLDVNPDGVNNGLPAYLAPRYALNASAANGDTDGDGVADVVELGADLDNPLDSDRDGVIDALESGSFATNAQVADGAPLPNDKSVRVTAAAGQFLAGVGGAEVMGMVEDVAFPLGLASFRSTVSVGGATTLEFQYSEELPVCPVVYSVGYEGELTRLADTAWSKTGDASIQVTLTDGAGTLDLDGAADGMIQNSVAVGADTADNNGNAFPDACEVPGDVDRDGDVDWWDVAAILSRKVLNQPASGPGDPRDFDGDGMITMLDVRKVYLACDIPGCQIIN